MANKPTIFTKTMVEQTIKYFADPKNADESDPAQMKALISDYVKFEKVVEKGHVTPEAKPLANDFLVYAREWMAKNKLEKLYRSLK